MKNTFLEAEVSNYKSLDGQVSIDEARGIVECFVAAIGNKDSVGDICLPGVFNASLMRRKPRVVWGHNWNEPIGKVLEIYEVPGSDPRLPAKMRSAGVGGLYARVQFNLKSERGREAFANVSFFGKEQEWSIGYKTLDAVYDPVQSANLLKEVELYEVSPVLHGANQLTGTISIKSDQYSKAAKTGPCWDGYKQVGMKKGKNGNLVPNCVPINSPVEKSAYKNPDGGLSAAGRAYFKRTQGSNLKPGVKGPADTPEKMRRKGSFLTRFFSNPRGPMLDEKGRPTRLALSAAAWGEPVPKDRSDAAKLAAKGRRLLERYQNTKEKSDEFDMETKFHLNDVYAAGITLARPEDQQRQILTQAVTRHFGGPCRIMYADPSTLVAEIRKDGMDQTLKIPYKFDGSNYMFGTSEQVTPETIYVPLSPTAVTKPDGGCGCDSCGQPMPSWESFKQHNPGKHLFIHSVDDIGLFDEINQISEQKNLDIELLEIGLTIKNIDNLDGDSYGELIQMIDEFEEKKLRTIGRMGRGVAARFDPDARDGDSDSLVQEDTPFERPRMMPAVPEEVPIPEKVPEPVPEKVPQRPKTPIRPSVPAPSRPATVPTRTPVRSLTGSMQMSKRQKLDKMIYDRLRANDPVIPGNRLTPGNIIVNDNQSENRMNQLAQQLKISKAQLRQAEERHMDLMADNEIQRPYEYPRTANTHKKREAAWNRELVKRNKRRKLDAAIYKQRMDGASLEEMAKKYKTTRERIRFLEQRYMAIQRQQDRFQQRRFRQ